MATYIVFNCAGVYEPHPLPEPALNERKYGAIILECLHAQCTKQAREYEQRRRPWDNMGEVSRGRYLGGECMPG